MDTGLAAELGLDRLDREATRLLAAVAAALADAFRDQHLPRGLGRRAALACATQLGRTRLIVDQHGHARHLRELALGLEQPGALADLGVRGQRDAAIARGVL